MKNLFALYPLLLLGFFLNAQNLKSPDNNLDLNFSIDKDGRAFYSLNFHDEPVILNSGLGFMLKDNVEWMKIDTLDMINNFKVLNVTFDSVDEYWNPVWGEESEIRNNYNEMFVELQEVLVFFQFNSSKKLIFPRCLASITQATSSVPRAS